MNFYLKRMFILVSFILGTTGLAFSQNIVTGIVEDADGPLIGASVLVKGTTRGTITDIDGQYSIEAKQGDVLEFSYMGYSPQSITVTDFLLNVTMKEDTEVLSEVVVTAMGIKRDRKALGYEVGEMKGEDLTKAGEPNVANAMAGRVAGLVVQETAGGASGSTRIVLRGTTEITGDNQPLYVIDGVPMDNTSYGQAGTEGGYDLGNGLSSINPDDIESMSVLKGPAAEVGAHKLSILNKDGSNVLIITSEGAVSEATTIVSEEKTIREGRCELNWGDSNVKLLESELASAAGETITKVTYK